MRFAILFNVGVAIAVLIYAAFIVACLISFRSLWSSKRQDNKKNRVHLERQRAIRLNQQRPDQIRSWATKNMFNTMRNRWNILLDTLADLEGTVVERNLPEHLPLNVLSGRLSYNVSSFNIEQQRASGDEPSYSSRDTHGSSVNDSAGLICSEFARDPEALAEENDLLPLAEPPPSYHRPGTVV